MVFLFSRVRNCDNSSRRWRPQHALRICVSAQEHGGVEIELRTPATTATFRISNAHPPALTFSALLGEGTREIELALV